MHWSSQSSRMLMFCYGSNMLARTKNAIQRVQNACARYIWNIPLRIHVSPFLLSAGVLRMEQRRRLHFASLPFDVVLSKAPSYLYDKLTWFGDGNNRYHTRIALYGLEMPLYHTTAFRGSFAYNATKCWNNLPPPIPASKTCIENASLQMRDADQIRDRGWLKFNEQTSCLDRGFVMP
ncbi:unnamed protein product [Leptosia nina]|uniref:Gamma-glutamylcyclotransferase n=1 Tax=Leptosia nina TaxID=320188 RepID=A0AAV1JV58_9NEOP